MAYLGYLSHFDLFCNEPRSEFLTTIRTKKIFNVTVVVWGDHPPELRAPIRRRRASMIYTYELIMMTEGGLFGNVQLVPQKLKMNSIFLGHTILSV